jgi:hypothetical protein
MADDGLTVLDGWVDNYAIIDVAHRAWILTRRRAVRVSATHRAMRAWAVMRFA